MPAAEYWAMHGGSPAEKARKQAQEFSADIGETNSQYRERTGTTGSMIDGMSSKDYFAKYPKTSTANTVSEVAQSVDTQSKVSGTTYDNTSYAREYARRQSQYLKNNPVTSNPTTRTAEQYSQAYNTAYNRSKRLGPSFEARQMESNYGRTLNVDDPLHTPRGYAAGHIPDAITEIRAAKRLGALNPVPMMGEGTIGGKKFMMNSEEIEIPRYGRNGDSAVIPKYAGGNMPSSAASNNISVPIDLSVNITAAGNSSGGSAGAERGQADQLQRNVNSLIPQLKASIENVVKETFERRVSSLESRVDRGAMSNSAMKPIPIGVDKSSATT
jgi:hypothetical protein